MRIITYTCPDCETIIAANVLESHRTMKCPGLNCENIVNFSDLTEEEQTYFLENIDQYSME